MPHLARSFVAQDENLERHNPLVRRVVVIIPGLSGEPSFLSQKLPTLERIAEMGALSKLQPVPNIETPEALYLGLAPGQGQLAQGPLTVSALGADPPTRSMHFHLSLMSFHDGVATSPKVEISGDDQRQVMELASKLNTKILTIVEGEGVDHGLVWENVGDVETTSAKDLNGQETRSHLPQGDAEIMLRRFIDDSINLLSEIELNRRRGEQDLPPINLLWPWGAGVRQPVPNLALRRGEPAMVLSGSMRMQGLARLCGYRHGDRHDFGRGTNVRLEKVAAQCLAEPATIVVLEAFQNFRALEQLEEGEWLAHELDNRFLKPLFEKALLDPTRMTLLAPGDGLGLAVAFETRNAGTNAISFDERALEEKSLARWNLWDSVAQALA